MKTEKKIFLEKSDGVDKALDELLETAALRVIVNVPKSSILGESIHNFQILKREAETAGKEIIIESIDEHILQLASLGKMTAVNPVFKTKERAVADIVPAFAAKKERNAAPEAEPSMVVEDVGEIEQVRKEVPRKKETEKKRERRAGNVLAEIDYQPGFAVEERSDPSRRHRKAKRKLAWGMSFIAVVAVVFVAVTYFLPRVTITVDMKKTSIDFDKQFLVSVAAASPAFSSTSIVLPGQIISAKSNLIIPFVGGASQYVETKAEGTLTVYNAYSANPQPLVATTRFLSPEGKLFRSLNKVIIPGEKTANGTTTPGSVTVAVAADQAGADYNIGPSTGWQIPGFQGTPRYGKFYAAALSPMVGGFVGTTTVPGKNDLAAAKREAEQKLQSVLASKLSLLNTNGLTALPSSSVFEVTTENVTGAQNGAGFNVFVEGNMRQITFDEAMLKKALLASASSVAGGSFKIDDVSINYGTSTADFSAGTTAFEVTGTLVYQSDVDFDKVKQSILGQDANALKATIFSLPGLQNANVSFWPFWVDRVPTNPSNVNLRIN